MMRVLDRYQGTLIVKFRLFVQIQPIPTSVNLNPSFLKEAPSTPNIQIETMGMGAFFSDPGSRRDDKRDA